MLQFREQPEEGEGKRLHSEKVYFRIIEWGTYLAMFTPLILVKYFYFPYVVPKTIFFRIIVDVIFIAYLLLAISNPRYRPKINALTITLAIFLGIKVLTAITGINFNRSFWSTFERMTGILTLFHLFAFFIILTSVFKERKYWERFFTISICAGILLCFYVFTSSDPTARGGGTLGNTSFMSAYVLFNVFFAISLFFTKSGGWRIFYGATLIPLLLLLLRPPQEPTQGAIGAFWGGIALFSLSVLLFYFFTSGKKLFKRIAISLIVLLVLGGIGFTQTDFFKNKIAEIGRSSSWEARAIVWKMGFSTWQERPWLGWGEDNFNIGFAKYFDPALAPTGDLWYDRVHNIVFDTLVSSGILGLLAYLAIFAVAVIRLLKICSKIVEKRNVFIPLGMIALLATYFAQNIWVFDMVSSYMTFFLTLSFIYFLTQGREEQSLGPEQPKMERVPQLIGGLLIVAAVFNIYFGNIKPALASHYTVMGIVYPLEKAVPYFQKAFASSPMAQIETSEQISRKVTDLTYEENVNNELLRQGFALAEKELKESISQNPQDFRLYLFLGKQYNSFYNFTGNKEVLGQAEETLKKAAELSPRNQQVYWSLAQAKFAQGFGKEAIELMQKSVDLNPGFSQSRWYLAMTYKSTGDFESAKREVEQAERDGYKWKDNLEDLKKVIEIYQELRDDKELVSLYSIATEMAPKDARFLAGLAVAYANLRQFDKARQYGQEAMALNPDFKAELEEFLRQLPQ